MCCRCRLLNRCQEAGRGNQDGDVGIVYWFCMVEGCDVNDIMFFNVRWEVELKGIQIDDFCNGIRS